MLRESEVSEDSHHSRVKKIEIIIYKCVSRTDIYPPFAFAFDIGFSRKFHFPLFLPPPGAANTQNGKDTCGTRVRPHAKFGVNRPAGCQEIVDKKRTKTKKHTVKQIPRPSL